MILFAKESKHFNRWYNDERKKCCFLLKILILQTSKLLMVGWISGQKSKEKCTATINKKFIFLS